MRWRLIISLLILSGLLEHTHSVFRRLLPQKPAAPHQQDPAHNSHLVRDLVATINDAVLASSRRLESADGEGRTATAANDRDGSWFARPALLLGSEDGAKLARKLARRGVAVVPLNANEELDAASAGQVAWSILPQVRRSLQARERLTRARTPE